MSSTWPPGPPLGGPSTPPSPPPPRPWEPPTPTPPTAPATPSASKPAKKAAKKRPAKKRAAKKRVAKKPVEKAAGPAGAPKPAAESELRAARRDPFESLLAHSQSKGPSNLPPGKAGLQVSTLRLDGIVRAPNGMIAVVSNPQARTYFLREGDHLYDGSVEKITMDGVSFHEEGKDAFGKPVERQVNKRIYSTSSGEQQ